MIGGVDVFFMPNIGFGAFSNKCRLVTTVHDLSFLRYPKTFSRKRKLWHFFINPKKICERTDKIIAVSQSTKDDITKFYGIDEKKIQVIYNGLSEKFHPISRNDEKLVKTKEKYDLPYKFILYFGTVEPRKNIAGIIKAFGRLRNFSQKDGKKEFENYYLVIAGEKGWLSGEILNEISRSEFKEAIKVINSVDEEDKEYFYNLASAFMYPSYFEGFGFPPLEAVKCKVPAVISNNSSMPEVLGNNAIMINPDNPDEIFSALKEILTDENLKKYYQDEESPWLSKFNWKSNANSFLKLIKNN